MIPQDFAHHCIEAWNAHDIDRILRHYADDVEYQSPFVAQLSDSSDGILHGSEAVRSYVQRALETYPDLQFSLWGVFSGVDSVVVRYQSVNKLTAAEFFQFNSEGKIARVVAHYSSGSS